MTLDWQSPLRKFKEQLAQRLWAVPSISEAEKELIYKEYLIDLDGLERAIANYHEEMSGLEKSATEEKDLLRSLLGVPHDQLRDRALVMGHDISAAKKNIHELEDERHGLAQKISQTEEENEFLRKRIAELQKKYEDFRLEQNRVRQDDVRYFSESHEALKNEIKDLETRLSNLRQLFTETNKQLLTEKQEEITVLQKKLLDDMEAALRHKQQLSWTEEDMFAKGVAHKVRATLVSAQGQLMLTLERLGFLDPETKSEASWKARLKLLMDGGDTLSQNFRAIQAQMQEVTKTLDDYLHLTGRRELATQAVQLKNIVNEVMGELYADRRPTLNVQLNVEDPLPAIEGDEEMLRFVVRCLLRNAVEAVPNQTGQIDITLKNDMRNGTLQFFVKDSGKGIPDHLLGRLFQPFMTTKDGRQGLSLSRAKRYVELHKGRIDVLETNPRGTTFRVEFPLKKAA